MEVSYSNGAYTFRDPGAVITAREACRSLSDHEVVCTPAAPLTRRSVLTEDMDDVVGAPTGEIPSLPNGLGFSISGGTGDDRLSGGEQADGLTGGEGDDVLIGGSGDDGLSGGGSEPLGSPGGRDELSGGPGDDSMADADLVADPGRNRAFGSFGPDTFDGGEGRDHLTYAYRGGAVTVDLATSTAAGEAGEGDTVAGMEDVTGGYGDDALAGAATDNRLIGGGGSDRLSGREGDDVLMDGELDRRDGDRDPRQGRADSFDGGSGSDLLVYAARSKSIAADLSRSGPIGVQGEGDTAANLEGVVGSWGDDILAGSAADNTLTGGLGDDRLVGLAGNDDLDGEDGSDTVSGGEGADRMTPGDDSDGRDMDTLDYSDRAGGVTLTVDGRANDGVGGEGDSVAPGFERVLGGPGDDFLRAGAGDNRLEGGTGNDVLEGGEGDDSLDGGLGRDSLWGGRDRSGRDIDTADYSSRSERVRVELVLRSGSTAGRVIVGNPARRETDVLAPGIERVAGGSGDDTFFGNALGNRLVGGVGSDRMFGRGGDDLLEGGAGGDVISAGAGRNKVVAGAGNDFVNALNRTRDSILCDGGRDAVTVDRLDHFSDCERIVRVPYRRR